MSTAPTREEYFASHTTIDSESGCFVWIGARAPNGYCRASFEKQRGYAHRFAFELFKGPIPDGMEIDHLCRNRACVNPAHLEAVPHRVNLDRSTSVSTLNKQKTTCPKGHPYDIRDGEGRRCRTCKNEAWRARYHAKKVERAA